ncbi:MAG: hypothetical protein IPI95_03930 [Flavobacteriales bacterium]|nr:hypothetical protein [Flavobacteriales bacterium]
MRHIASSLRRPSFGGKTTGAGLACDLQHTFHLIEAQVPHAIGPGGDLHAVLLPIVALHHEHGRQGEHDDIGLPVALGDIPEVALHQGHGIARCQFRLA